MASARSLVKRYRSVTALDGVDLEIGRGEVFGLIGPNGAGKTTLIRAIVGALRPTAGTVRVLGHDPLADRWELRRQIGYMPQQPALYSDLTAQRNVEFFAAAHRRDGNDAGTDRALELVGLSDRANDPARVLSGGMQQRLSLACALVHDPAILLLDEPTAGVDPELRASFWEEFRELAASGTTVIVSTHQMGEALQCDRVALLRSGRVLATEAPGVLLRSQRATVHVWRNGEEHAEVLDDYPAELPHLLQHGAERVEIELEPLDDIVLRLVKGDEQT